MKNENERTRIMAKKSYSKLVNNYNVTIRIQIAKVCSIITTESKIPMDLSKITGTVQGNDLLTAIRLVNSYAKAD